MSAGWKTITLGLVILSFLSEGALFGAPIYNADADGYDIWQKANEDEIPGWGIEVHKINNLLLAVSNGGSFGAGVAYSFIDPETGQPGPSCEYPAGSNITYLFYGAFWAGAIVGRDTLVSVGFDGNYFVREFWPDFGERGGIQRRSNMPSSLEYHDDAVSEQDFICTYTDTMTDVGLTGVDPIDNRLHAPLGLEVKQRTYAWSYEYAADFILFDFTIRNMNRFPLQQTYFAIYVDADVYHKSNQGGPAWRDDIVGYIHDIPSPEAPGFLDTVRIAWAADNDGDPSFHAGGEFDYSSGTSVTGTAVLRTPNPDMKYSFNWWMSSGYVELDWGPRMAGTEERPFRSFGSRLGSPDGDRNKYYMMSSNEFDYDQLESALNHAADGWLEPPSQAADFADGYDSRYLLSFGPFDLQPGDTLPITLAYVAGENFHVNGSDFIDYWDPLNPDEYKMRLDVSDLGKNAKWAHWIFDNPGFDADGDGDSGKVRWVVDSISMDSTCVFYEGDGVPDFRGAAPPPAPIVRVIPDFGKLRVIWNGKISENSIDIFSGLNDFEGYRLYYGEDNRLSDYVRLATYDVEDYNVYSFNARLRRWNIGEVPLRRDSLQKIFGADFDPNLYARPDESCFNNGIAYYFIPQDWNYDDLSNPLGIHRIYPGSDPQDPSDTTDEGFHRYYEYEFVIDNLQPSKPYYLSVTAFDYGSRKAALSSLESSPNINAVMAYPLTGTEEVEEEGLNVKVYPNPYRIDAGYARTGYENRDRTRSAERARSIHFYNLPSICTIRIFTIDGDLVKEIKHYCPEGGPMAQHERWNLISRNTQVVVTGIYLFQVSSEMGDQLGKIVIIK
jgi:hypothetical protein